MWLSTPPKTATFLTHCPTRRWYARSPQSKPHSGQRPSGTSQSPRVDGARSVVTGPSPVPAAHVPAGADVAPVHAQLDAGLVSSLLGDRQRLTLREVRGLRGSVGAPVGTEPTGPSVVGRGPHPWSPSPSTCHRTILQPVRPRPSRGLGGGQRRPSA